MKKSASGSGFEGATRITPSAPTPRCRSQIAATRPGERRTRSSRSSIRTKSFPVPWYFANRSSSIGQVPRDLLLERRRIGTAEPSRPRISAEPGALPSRERPGASDGSLDRLVQRARPVQVARHLSVPDGLARGEPSTEAAAHEAVDLLHEAA